MNNQTQIGITIAGVAVVSAVAAVVLNKLLPDKPQVRDSYARSYPEEKAEDTYPGYDSDEDPNHRDQSWSRAEHPKTYEPIKPRTLVEPSAPPRPSFNDNWAYEASMAPKSDSVDWDSAPAPLPIVPPTQPLAQPSQQPPSQGMMGGMRQTRCKHCHSRIKYTRRR